MKSIMDRNPLESSFSFSRRYFQRRFKPEEDHSFPNDQQGILPLSEQAHYYSSPPPPILTQSHTTPLSRFKSAFSLFSKSLFSTSSSSSSLGSRVTVTLFGHRRGHVRFAIQESPKAIPEFVIEMSTQTNKLVQEMASGLVRIALEADMNVEKKTVPLLQEPLWRSYCNGRSCGYATRKDCGEEELEVLKVMESVSMGAGVLPTSGDNDEGEVMYMRSRFERVARSKHFMTFYMMNPDRNGGPELSIYLIRV